MINSTLELTLVTSVRIRKLVIKYFPIHSILWNKFKEQNLPWNFRAVKRRRLLRSRKRMRRVDVTLQSPVDDIA